MSKILDKIFDLKKDFSADWRPELERLGILDDVHFLYKEKWSTDFCNRVLAFVILAYDNESGWLEIHKNRWGNKEKIATRLGLDIKQQVVKNIIENSSQTVINLVAWFVDYQADWRWEAVLSHFEFASEMMRFARTKTEDSIVVDVAEGGKKILQEVDIETLSKGNTAKGKNLIDAIDHRRKGDEMLKEIQSEFVTLDTALQKEDKRKATDKESIENWQQYIKELRGHQ